MSTETGKRRIGVYVCHCGGNISDYVDVDKVVAALEGDPDVVVAKTAMFTCSDATQQEIIEDIQEQGLDGIVVASCSPKLHTFTFREVAKRAGLSPFQYTQVNVREQCSWTHTDDHEGATDKATKLVKAGIGRTRLTVPLEPIVVETVPKAVVIGGGITGLRAALGLAEIGLARVPGGEGGAARRLGRRVRRDVPVRQERPGAGGRADREGARQPGHHGVHERRGHRQGRQLRQLRGGHPGERRRRRSRGRAPRPSPCEAGSIIVATGFDAYPVAEDEFGYGLDGVVTLPEFKQLVDGAERPARSTTASRSRTSSTSTAWAAGRTRTRWTTPTSTAPATAARPRCTPPSQVAAKPGQASTSTTCTATSAPTASTRCCTTSRSTRAPSTSRCPTTSRRW